MTKKENFQDTFNFWGWLSIRLFSVSVWRESLPFPQLLVPSQCSVLALQWSRWSAHTSVWKLLRRWAEGGLSALPAYRCGHFLNRSTENKHSGQPRQSRRTEAKLLPTVDLVYAALGATPAHLCQLLAHSLYKGWWHWSLFSLAVLNN